MIRYILSVILSLLCFSGANAAGSAGKISFYPVVTGPDIPGASGRLIVSKMEQALTQNGFGTINRADRFVLLAKCNVVLKDVAPTTPPRISQRVEVTFILGDVVENQIYSSASIELSGIGTDETKAWQAAINGLKPTNPVFKQMFDEASEKIESYYAGHCESIIAKSRTLASTGKSDEAIANLMNVPDICAECYEKAMTVAGEIYQNKIDAEGVSLLTKAKNAWAASPDEEGACLAMDYLNEISVNSSSVAEAETLANSISKKMSSEKERERQFKQRQYKDEKEFLSREQADSHARAMAAIEAARTIAEKWAENQSETKVYLNW